MHLGLDTLPSQQSYNDGTRIDYLSVKENQSVTVRFLETPDKFRWTYVQNIPVPGSQYPKQVPTLDVNNDGEVDCPLRQFTGKNPSVRGYLQVIWRDAPKPVRTKDGGVEKDQNNNIKYDGVEDRICVWSQGVKVLKNLGALNSTLEEDGYNITECDIKISRTGSGKNTTYTLIPRKQQALSASDKKIAENPIDITSLLTPPSLEEALKLVNGSDNNSHNDDVSVHANPFMS